MTTLWDTTGTDVVKALGDERRNAGAFASGLVLTLIAVVDEAEVGQAERAATAAAAAHPCRLIVVVRSQLSAPTPRLDAEVAIGGRLGPGEAVVLRMAGRLGLHAESVVLPLLAPDAPVVTWWFGTPPDLIAHDPLGVFADRRVTDIMNAADPLEALKARARDYVSGDTDLAWTRITPWRGVLAGAYDAVTGVATAASVEGEAGGPSATLLACWLGSRLGLEVPVVDRPGLGVQAAAIEVDGGAAAGGVDIRIVRDSERAGTLSRTGEPDRTMSLPRSEVGDLLAEELRRLEDDPVYAAAICRAADIPVAAPGRRRVHIWRDPAEKAAASSS